MNEGEKCPCPKPCTQTVYEPSLSQASLSVLSVDNILREGFDTLLVKYREYVSFSFQWYLTGLLYTNAILQAHI